MKDSKLNQFFQQIFDGFNRYRFVILGIVVLLVIWRIYVFFFPKKSEPLKPAGSKHLDVTPENTDGSSMSDSLALSKAEQLFKAMNYIFGTDEDVIFSILGDISRADYNKIYNAFGIRYYNNVLGESTIPLFGLPYTLTDWLVHDLSPKELSELKKLNPKLPL